jgi:hypothetical protein
MFSQAIVHQDFGSVEERFASLTGGGRELSLLVVTQEEAMAALAHVQEDAAIEAEDVLVQADEALVLG